MPEAKPARPADRSLALVYWGRRGGGAALATRIAQALARDPRFDLSVSYSVQSEIEAAELARIRAPTLVVGSRDEADPSHPLATARRYARALPGARLHVEEEGRSPLAWQGGQLSRLLLDF